MSLLYFWRLDNYRRDRVFGFGYHLNQNSPAMATVGPGDSLWAFTRRARDGLYLLAAELIVGGYEARLAEESSSNVVVPRRCSGRP